MIYYYIYLHNFHTCILLFCVICNPISIMLLFVWLTFLIEFFIEMHQQSILSTHSSYQWLGRLGLQYIWNVYISDTVCSFHCYWNILSSPDCEQIKANLCIAVKTMSGSCILCFILFSVKVKNERSGKIMLVHMIHGNTHLQCYIVC
jgi:hypothetical protein